MISYEEEYLLAKSRARAFHAKIETLRGFRPEFREFLYMIFNYELVDTYDIWDVVWWCDFIFSRDIGALVLNNT